MVIYMFSNSVYEYAAETCIKSLIPKISTNVHVVYFTIGFESAITAKNVTTVFTPINKLYPNFTYYKPELALKVMDMFPQESNFLFTDVDVLFTHRIDFTKLVHQENYPLAVYSANEYPFRYIKTNTNIIYFTEKELMKYFNVSARSMRYQLSCFFAYNRQCVDFLEEWTSMCKNEYLLKRENTYFPFSDETPMNICLWKRTATKSLGHLFVNTVKFDTVKFVEESSLQNTFLQRNLDELGNDNEYVHDTSSILFYHGLKDKDEVVKSLNYLLNKHIMKEKLSDYYNSIQKRITPLQPNFTYHNINGMFLEINGGETVAYDVSFINAQTNAPVYSAQLHKEHWARTSVQYYVDWIVSVKNTNTNITTQYQLNLKNKQVFIVFESKSLGDTLAWIPYVDEFRKKHNCNIICSTFWNDMFTTQYPDIKFVEPGKTVDNIYALYRLGIFYTETDTIDMSRHPRNPINLPLQQIAADILGLEYREIKPKIKLSSVQKDKKLVTIAIHSTAQSKYWNNPTGWQDVVDWLNNRGYTVKLLSQEPDGYMGNKNPTGVIQHPAGPIDLVMEELLKSHMFIGVSSGLSWLSWATGTPTVIISGFSDPISEMQGCIRITAPLGSCTGCFNRIKFNPGDWNWCPDHKDTPRQFECSRNITSDVVIKELEKLL